MRVCRRLCEGFVEALCEGFVEALCGVLQVLAISVRGW